MANIQPRNQRGLDRPIGSRQDRRWVAEVRLRAQLEEFAEYAEAARLEARITAGRRLADQVASELMLVHEEFTQLAGGNAALELDLRDVEQTLKIGYVRLLQQYLGRR